MDPGQHVHERQRRDLARTGGRRVIPDHHHDPGPEAVTQHLVTDPNFSQEAAERIVTVVQEIYRAHATSAATAPDRSPLTLHLRAASIMRPGVPDRLAGILQDMRSALEARASSHRG
jgi:hypothetical protein